MHACMDMAQLFKVRVAHIAYLAILVLLVQSYDCVYGQINNAVLSFASFLRQAVSGRTKAQTVEARRSSTAYRSF